MGSIDLHWKNDRFELLINVPRDPDSPMAYYGDDYGVDSVKGTFEFGVTTPTAFIWLALRR
jgi:hypothetical protein